MATLSTRIQMTNDLWSAVIEELATSSSWKAQQARDKIITETSKGMIGQSRKQNPQSNAANTIAALGGITDSVAEMIIKRFNAGLPVTEEQNNSLYEYAMLNGNKEYEAIHFKILEQNMFKDIEMKTPVVSLDTSPIASNDAAMHRALMGGSGFDGDRN